MAGAGSSHHVRAWRWFKELELPGPGPPPPQSARAPADRDAGEHVILWAFRVGVARGHPISRHKRIAAMLRILWGLRDVPGYAASALRFVTHSVKSSTAQASRADPRQRPTFDVDAVAEYWTTNPVPHGSRPTVLRDRAIAAIAVSTAQARQAETLRAENDIEVSFLDKRRRPKDPVAVTPAMLLAPMPPSVHALFVYTRDKGQMLRADAARVPLVVVHRADLGVGQPTCVLWQYMQARGVEPRGWLFPNSAATSAWPDPSSKLSDGSMRFALRRVLVPAGVPIGLKGPMKPSETRKAAYTKTHQRDGEVAAAALGRWMPGSTVPQRHYQREIWRGIAPNLVGGASDMPVRRNRSQTTAPAETISTGIQPGRPGHVVREHGQRQGGETLPLLEAMSSDDESSNSSGVGSGPGPVHGASM